MVMLKKSFVLALLKEELEAHKKINPKETMISEEFKNAFIKGLKHAIMVVNNIK